MSQPHQYDLIIVGGGAIGLATAYHASKRGAKTLVLEQYEFFNSLSNSGGETRQFRIQYAEEYMARLVLDAIPLWDELQQHSDAQLRTRSGSLWFGDPAVSSSEGELTAAMEVLTKLELPFEELNPAQIEARYGFRNLQSLNYSGFIQPDGGTVNVPATLRTLAAQAQLSTHVEMLADRRITAIESHADWVSVRTDTESFAGSKLVVAAGPFTNQVLCTLGVSLDVLIWQMVSCYFRKRSPEVDFPSWFMFGAEVEHYNPNLFYGFEHLDWAHPGFIRVAPAFALHSFRDPAERSERPEPLDLWLTSQWVAKHMPGLDPEPRFTSWCMAALPTDPYKKMFLDFAPDKVPHHHNIVVFSAGWAFKYVPLIGHICVDLALDGRTSYDVTPFAIGTSPAPAARRAVEGLRRLPF